MADQDRRSTVWLADPRSVARCMFSPNGAERPNLRNPDDPNGRPFRWCLYHMTADDGPHLAAISCRFTKLSGLFESVDDARLRIENEPADAHAGIRIEIADAQACIREELAGIRAIAQHRVTIPQVVDALDDGGQPILVDGRPIQVVRNPEFGTMKLVDAMCCVAGLRERLQAFPEAVAPPGDVPGAIVICGRIIRRLLDVIDGRVAHAQAVALGGPHGIPLIKMDRLVASRTVLDLRRWMMRTETRRDARAAGIRETAVALGLAPDMRGYGGAYQHLYAGLGGVGPGGERVTDVAQYIISDVQAWGNFLLAHYQWCGEFGSFLVQLAEGVWASRDLGHEALTALVLEHTNFGDLENRRRQIRDIVSVLRNHFPQPVQDGDGIPPRASVPRFTDIVAQLIAQDDVLEYDWVNEHRPYRIVELAFRRLPLMRYPPEQGHVRQPDGEVRGGLAMWWPRELRPRV